MQATTDVVDTTERGVIICLLVGEEVMTDAMAVKDESHVLGVADELERTDD